MTVFFHRLNSCIKGHFDGTVHANNPHADIRPYARRLVEYEKSRESEHMVINEVRSVDRISAECVRCVHERSEVIIRDGISSCAIHILHHRSEEHRMTLEYMNTFACIRHEDNIRCIKG